MLSLPWSDHPSLPALLLGPVFLALIHVFAAHLPSLGRNRSDWRSFAAGVSIAYVFIHILPVIAHLSALAGEGGERWPQGEWVFALALAGTCGYYAVEKLVQSREPASEETPALFFVHILAFALYNALIGYMLTDYPPRNALDGFAFFGALALHFLLVDRDLRARHRRLYDRVGQWVMAGAVLGGAVAGVLDILPLPVMIGGFAFLAGGMILNVLKEELPAHLDGRFLPFAAGAGLFGLIFVLA